VNQNRKEDLCSPRRGLTDCGVSTEAVKCTTVTPFVRRPKNMLCSVEMRIIGKVPSQNELRVAVAVTKEQAAENAQVYPGGAFTPEDVELTSDLKEKERVFLWTKNRKGVAQVRLNVICRQPDSSSSAASDAGGNA
jgi:hypothetical protein